MKKHYIVLVLMAGAYALIGTQIAYGAAQVISAEEAYQQLIARMEAVTRYVSDQPRSDVQGFIAEIERIKAKTDEAGQARINEIIAITNDLLEGGWEAYNKHKDTIKKKYSALDQGFWQTYLLKRLFPEGAPGISEAQLLMNKGSTFLTARVIAEIERDMPDMQKIIDSLNALGETQKAEKLQQDWELLREKLAITECNIILDFIRNKSDLAKIALYKERMQGLIAYVHDIQVADKLWQAWNNLADDLTIKTLLKASTPAEFAQNESRVQEIIASLRKRGEAQKADILEQDAKKLHNKLQTYFAEARKLTDEYESIKPHGKIGGSNIDNDAVLINKDEIALLEKLSDGIYTKVDNNAWLESCKGILKDLQARYNKLMNLGGTEVGVKRPDDVQAAIDLSLKNDFLGKLRTVSNLRAAVNLVDGLRRGLARYNDLPGPKKKQLQDAMNVVLAAYKAGKYDETEKAKKSVEKIDTAFGSSLTILNTYENEKYRTQLATYIREKMGGL